MMLAWQLPRIRLGIQKGALPPVPGLLPCLLAAQLSSPGASCESEMFVEPPSKKPRNAKAMFSVDQEKRHKPCYLKAIGEAFGDSHVKTKIRLGNSMSSRGAKRLLGNLVEHGRLDKQQYQHSATLFGANDMSARSES